MALGRTTKHSISIHSGTTFANEACLQLHFSLLQSEINLITVCTHKHTISILVFFTETSGLLLSSIHFHKVRETFGLILLKPDCRSKRRGIAGYATSPISALQNNPEAGRPSYQSTYILLPLCKKGQQARPASNHWPPI